MDIIYIYPKLGEGLVEFHTRKKDLERDVILHPQCSVVFNKNAAKAYETSKTKKHYKRLAKRDYRPKDKRQTLKSGSIPDGKPTAEVYTFTPSKEHPA